MLCRPAGEIIRLSRSCGFPGVLPDFDQSDVEGQRPGGEVVPLAQVLGPPAGSRPRTRLNSRHGHHIFSMLTRNALNSGVRELASPTNGVSALASQCWPVLMPTKPQWMGIPIW